MNPDDEKLLQPINGNRPAADWEYYHFTDKQGGQGAADWLNQKHPRPENVYATYQSDANVFHVWLKSGNSPVRYKYDYLLWDPAKPGTVLPPANPKITAIPIGFGSADGKPAFIFFSIVRE